MNIWTRFFVLVVTAYCVVHAMFYGELVEQEDFPYMVAFICKNRAGDEYNCCSGIILTRRFILTTGFCVNPQSPHFTYNKDLIGVRIGSTSALGGELCTIGQILDRSNYETLALVEVSKELVFSDTLGHAFLPAKEAPEPDQLQQCQYLGWGGGDDSVSYTVDGMRLRYSYVTFLSTKTCALDEAMRGYRENDMFCTSTRADSDAAIRGTAAFIQDKGGPLLCDYVVYGLIDVVKDHRDTAGYMGSINVRMYVDWVESTLKDKNDPMLNS